MQCMEMEGIVEDDVVSTDFSEGCLLASLLLFLLLTDASIVVSVIEVYVV